MFQASVCKDCKNDLIPTTSPNGTPLFYCNRKFCTFYGKILTQS